MSVSLNCFYRQYAFNAAYNADTLFDNGDAEISGRVCLRNAWITTVLNASNPYWSSVKIANGTEYSDSNVVLELPYVCNAVADIYTNVKIPGNGMLFEDGLSFRFSIPTQKNSADGSFNLIQTVTLLYSGGATSIVAPV
tara:strand:- start:727 stop:1143 length:417 start_codon:yes stop_codon:yes gene_type:complete